MSVNMLDYLTRVAEYFDRRADADHDGERYVVNEEMSLLRDTEELLAQVQRETDIKTPAYAPDVICSHPDPRTCSHSTPPGPALITDHEFKPSLFRPERCIYGFISPNTKPGCGALLAAHAKGPEAGR